MSASPLYGRRKKTSNPFSSGLLYLLGVQSGGWPRRAPWRAAGVRVHFSVSISGAATTKTGSIRLLRASGPCGSCWRRLRDIWLSRAAARCRRAGLRLSCHQPFEPMGSSANFSRFDRRAGCHRCWGPAVCRRRAALGVVHTPRSLRALGLVPGSFERRYNPRLHLTAPRAFFPFSPW